MKNNNQKPFCRIKVLGLYFYFSRRPMRLKLHSKTRNLAQSTRYELCGRKCEACGRDLLEYGRLVHTLPVGAPNRNDVENIRIFCNDCHNELERHHIMIVDNLIMKKGGEQ